MKNPPGTVVFTHWIFAFLVAGFLVTHGACAVAAEEINTERVLSLMRKAMRQPERVAFSQDVEATGIIGRWRFSANVQRSGNEVSVQASKAPSFIPPDLLADLADFEKALSGFILEYKGKERVDGRMCYVLHGVRRPQLYSGATEGRIWIDEQENLIRQTEARYSWGTVRVNHTYTRLEGYTVLAQQKASISPLVTHMTITYRDYRLGN